MLFNYSLLAISYKTLVLLSLFGLLIVNISCYREPINIDLSDFENNIVIEGSITDRLGTHSVRITRTTKYNGKDEFPAVSGALVKIEDDLDNFYPFYEREPGVYQASSIRGIPGRNYTLTVMVDDEIYTASSTMPEPMLLKVLKFNSITRTDNIFELSCTFADRAGIKDYCLLNVYLNGHLIDFYLYQDTMTDGLDITLDNFDFIFYQNDYVNIELITFDEAAYEFYRTLDKIGNSENEDDEFAGALLPVTSFNPTTNLDNGALGFFSAHTVRKYTRSFN